MPTISICVALTVIIRLFYFLKLGLPSFIAHIILSTSTDIANSLLCINDIPTGGKLI